MVASVTTRHSVKLLFKIRTETITNKLLKRAFSTNKMPLK